MSLSLSFVLHCLSVSVCLSALCLSVCVFGCLSISLSFAAPCLCVCLRLPPPLSLVYYLAWTVHIWMNRNYNASKITIRFFSVSLSHPSCPPGGPVGRELDWTELSLSLLPLYPHPTLLHGLVKLAAADLNCVGLRERMGCVLYCINGTPTTAGRQEPGHDAIDKSHMTIHHAFHRSLTSSIFNLGGLRCSVGNSRVPSVSVGLSVSVSFFFSRFLFVSHSLCLALPHLRYSICYSFRSFGIYIVTKSFKFRFCVSPWLIHAME